MAKKPAEKPGATPVLEHNAEAIEALRAAQATAMKLQGRVRDYANFLDSAIAAGGRGGEMFGDYGLLASVQSFNRDIEDGCEQLCKREHRRIVSLVAQRGVVGG